MNKKIITLFLITTSTLSYGMEKENNNKLIQTSYDRYNTSGIDKQKNFSRAKKLLTQKKAHPDSRKTTDDPTPLMLAIYHKDSDYMGLLLEYGADPYKKARYPGKTEPINCFEMVSDDSVYKQIKNLMITQANLQDNSLLNKIARKRSNPTYIAHNEINLSIAHRLLEHGANPDFRSHPHDPTPLMIAVCGNDKAYAHLLVWYTADPHKTGMWVDSSLKNSFEIEKERDNCCEKNAFDMEPTGWLQRMVDERKQTIFRCWLFKNHNVIEECTLLPELVQLIIYNTWNIGKTYNEK